MRLATIRWASNFTLQRTMGSRRSPLAVERARLGFTATGGSNDCSPRVLWTRIRVTGSPMIDKRLALAVAFAFSVLFTPPPTEAQQKDRLSRDKFRIARARACQGIPEGATRSRLR